MDKTHELRVAQVVLTGSSVDTLYPKGTEVALFVLTVAVSVGKTFFPGVFSYGPYITAAAKVASCKFEDFLRRARDATWLTDLGIVSDDFEC